MHDPLVVAHTIRRPWPKISRPNWSQDRRIGVRYSWRRWYDLRPKAFKAFWRFGPVELYWPGLITIWHVEPNGHDSFTVCKHSSQWKWHVHHWRIQVHPLQHFRRWALTRCEWCGGRSRRGDYVNVSHSWDGERGQWWRGEPGLFHAECSSVHSAHLSCTCGVGPFEHRDYGTCASCGKFRAWRSAADDQAAGDAATRLYAALGQGQRPTPEVRDEAHRLWAEQRVIDDARRAVDEATR
jgi:hypothetical protein